MQTVKQWNEPQQSNMPSGESDHPPLQANQQSTLSLFLGS